MNSLLGVLECNCFFLLKLVPWLINALLGLWVVMLNVFLFSAVKAPSNIDSTDQKKTKTKLKKFLTRRPTLQAVREKGYIKGK